MASVNVKPKAQFVQNHHGLSVKKPNAEQALLRLTLANMLFEDSFYVDGATIADATARAVSACKPEFVATVAKKARTEFKLRHAPLLLVRELARNKTLKAEYLDAVIQRADEMGEFLSLYWKDGKTPIANQVKKGLAMAFGKFNEYQLAKFDKNSAAVSVRDVMFLARPTPKDEAQVELFKKVANKQLSTPDTWETNLSAGADKKETFERLMAEKKLGALAFLRNLRNMTNAGIPDSVIRAYAKELDVAKVLPFRYIAAARVVPKFEDMLEELMLKSLAGHEKLPGKTKIVIDVSGSMFGSPVSKKSDLDRFDAAAALAVLCREICEEVEIWSFSNDAVRVAPRRGFALVEAIRTSQPHGGTTLGRSLRTVGNDYDRVIVFTDEQSSDRPASPSGIGYIINVASYEHGIGNGTWTTITGFSEAVVDYIQAIEKL